MAAAGSGWSITGKSPNLEYTHKWAIENFDFAMEVGGGKIESHSFSIPGVPGEFNMVVQKKQEYSSGSGRKVSYKMPTCVKIGDQELEIKFYFSVTLQKKGKETNAAGKLEVIKEGEETLSGHFGDSANHKFVWIQLGCDFIPNCALKCQDNEGIFRDATQNGFYTTGSTYLLNLVAKITIAGKQTSLGGREEEEEKQNRLLDFQPLLSDPKHSDIVLKCGETKFFCHKAILALR